MSSKKPLPCTFRELLAIPGVRPLWVGQLVSIAGDFLAIFAVLSIASFRLHGTAAQITCVSISYMLPLALFGPLAGVLVDRWNPKRTMVRSDLVRAGLALLLIFVTRFDEIYAILFAISTISTFFIPAQTVTVRTLVPRESLLTMNATLQQAMLLTRIASPAIAGALVARIGPASCFYLDSISFVLSALLIGSATLQSPKQSPQSSRQAGTILRELGFGIRFILTHPTISFVMVAMASATFAISCFSPLIVLFVRDILHSDTKTFGMISATIGLGIIAGTQGARRVRLGLPAQRIVLSLAVIATGIVLMGAATVAAIIGLGAGIMGAGVGLLMAPAQTLIQSETPIPIAGRVSSAVMSMISLAQILGLVLSGMLASTVGIRPLFFSSAVMLGGLAAAGAWKLNQQKIPLTELNTVN